MIENNEIKGNVEITLTPDEFQGIQYALGSVVRHEGTDSSKHYSHIRNASGVLQRAVEEEDVERINSFYDSTYGKK